MKCIICNLKNIEKREYCNSCYTKGLSRGTILALVRPTLPKILSKAQESILIGSMLGDGNLSKTKVGDARFNIGRAKKDLKYLE